MNILSLTLLLSAFTILCTAVRPLLVTSPSTCFTNHDCSGGTYCDNESNYSRTASHSCKPFVPVGGKCYKHQCASGLFCIADGEYPFNGDYTCPRRVSLGSSCTSDEACAGYPDLTCPITTDESKKRVCVAKPVHGALSDRCDLFAYGGQCELGLYFESGTRKCRPQKNGGFKCKWHSHEQCINGSWVDVTLRSNTENYGVPNVDFCAPLQEEGEKCTAEKQCAMFSTGDIVCNMPRWSTGTCVPIVKLLTSPVQKCYQRNDECDAQRGLSCRRGGNDLQYVCTQRASDVDVGIQKRDCTPGADRRLSSYKPHNDVSTECCKGKKHVLRVFSKDRERATGKHLYR